MLHFNLLVGGSGQTGYFNGANWVQPEKAFDSIFTQSTTQSAYQQTVGASTGTLNPTWPGTSSALIFGSGNMTITKASPDYLWTGAVGPKLPTAGKWYWEVYCTVSGQEAVGICNSNVNLNPGYPGWTFTNGWHVTQGGVVENGSQTHQFSSNNAAPIRYGIAWDADNRRLYIYNPTTGTWYNDADPVGGTNSPMAQLPSNTYYVLVGNTGNAGAVVTANFGASAFQFTPPTGYSKLVDSSAFGPTYLGKKFGAPTTFNAVRLYSSTDGGFTNGSQGQTITCQIYGSNVLPTSGTNGTLLGTTTFTDTNSIMKEIDFTSGTYRYWWVYFNYSYHAAIAEIELLNLSPAVLSITPTSQSGMNVTGVSDGITAYGNDVAFTVSNTGQLPSSTIIYSLSNTTNFEFHGGTLVSGVSTISAGNNGTIIIRPKASVSGSYSGNLVVNGLNISTSGSGSGFISGKHFLFGVDTNSTPGVMFVSSDANSWTKVTNSPFYTNSSPIWSITKSTGTGMYVAGGSGFICTSMDGINWSMPSNQLNTTLNHEYAIQGLCYGNGVFIAAGGWHSQFAQRSTDGINWTDITSATRSAGISYVNKTTVAHGNGKFVMHNYYGGTAWSTDGISWTSVSSAPGYGEIVFANGRFFVGMYGTAYYHSTDGINWTSASIPGTGSNCQISYNGTSLFAGTMSISTDGLNWTDKSGTYAGPGSGGNAYLSASTTAIVAVGYSSTTVSKSFNNGDSWTTDPTVQFGYSGAVYIQGNATQGFWC